MAKPAKAVDGEVTNNAAKKFTRDILACFERIDSERAKFARHAKSERDRMTVLYEGMAQQGVPQRASKVHIKIARALQKIQGWIADLENDERKQAMKLAQAHGDKQQLSFWDDVPTDKPKKKKAKEPKQKDMDDAWAEAEPAGQA